MNTKRTVPEHMLSDADLTAGGGVLRIVQPPGWENLTPEQRQAEQAQWLRGIAELLARSEARSGT